jgi:hypothetical protein
MEEQTELEFLRERVSKLEAALNQNSRSMVLTFNLTPGLANLLGMLVALTYVDADTAQSQVGAYTNLKVAICRLRKELAKHEVTIQSRRFSGYWLTEEHKEIIRNLLTDKVSKAA